MTKQCRCGPDGCADSACPGRVPAPVNPVMSREELIAAAESIGMRFPAPVAQGEPDPVAVVSSVTGPGSGGVRVKWLRGFPQIGTSLYMAAPVVPKEQP